MMPPGCKSSFVVLPLPLVLANPSPPAPLPHRGEGSTVFSWLVQQFSTHARTLPGHEFDNLIAVDGQADVGRSGESIYRGAERVEIERQPFHRFAFLSDRTVILQQIGSVSDGDDVAGT